MTEKRFTYAHGFKIVAIRDNGEIMNSIKVCELLNKLNDENIELHIQNDFLKDENQHMRDLVNENELLKQLFIDYAEVDEDELEEELDKLKEMEK
jgi:hypothetical protein